MSKQIKLTEDEKEMKEAADESLKEEANIGENKLQTIPADQSVALPGQFKGINIEGLEGVPASMVAVPYCRIIQPTSKKTILKNGKEAVPGNFMFNDIQEEVGELNFALLRAKVDTVKVDTEGNYATPDYQGEVKTKPIVKLLGVTLDTDKLFVLTITASAFSNWGKLMAQLKGLHVDKSYRLAIKSFNEKRENKKGKYYVPNFQLEGELSKEQFDSVSIAAKEYGVVLDRQIQEEAEE